MLSLLSVCDSTVVIVMLNSRQPDEAYFDDGNALTGQPDSLPSSIYNA